MKTFVLLLFLIVCTAGSGASEETSAIVAATKSFVAANSAISQVTVTVEKVQGDFARAKVAPKGTAQTDPAWVFLKKKNGAWSGLTMGTAFERSDYKALGIPAALWVK